MIIPHHKLSADALKGIIEAFVTQEGGDAFDISFSLEEKAEQVLAQLNSGSAVIVFDPVLETCNIVTSEDANTYLNSNNSDPSTGQ